MPICDGGCGLSNNAGHVDLYLVHFVGDPVGDPVLHGLQLLVNAALLPRGALPQVGVVDASHVRPLSWLCNLRSTLLWEFRVDDPPETGQTFAGWPRPPCLVDVMYFYWRAEREEQRCRVMRTNQLEVVSLGRKLVVVSGHSLIGQLRCEPRCGMGHV